MTQIRLFNSLSRAKELLTPIEPGHVRIYVCGPTVYDLSHLGHARVYVVFDTLVRLLRRYFKVTYARNFTDVDDKIINRARAEKTEPTEVSERNIKAFLEDMDRLSVLPPDLAPKVTCHLPDIIALVQHLLSIGAAYQAGNDVYFSVSAAAGYGNLARRTLEQMQAGARVEVSKHKKHPMDFALWKGAKEGEPFWEAPFGAGRPGWHIECSAMIKALLGDEIDIHGGGRDLMFPHHENEIAQSQAATGKPLARLWMHNGLLNIDNQKMAKSLGNFFTIREMLDKYTPQALRYFLLATHYRSPMQFALAGLEQAEARIQYLYQTLQRLSPYKVNAPPSDAAPPALREPNLPAVREQFFAALCDDLNTPRALSFVAELLTTSNTILNQPQDKAKDAQTLGWIAHTLAEFGEILGFMDADPNTFLQAEQERKAQLGKLSKEAIEARLAQRTAARANKDFRASDAIRQELEAQGIAINDGPQGTTWRYL